MPTVQNFALDDHRDLADPDAQADTLRAIRVFAEASLVLLMHLSENVAHAAAHQLPVSWLQALLADPDRTGFLREQAARVTAREELPWREDQLRERWRKFRALTALSSQLGHTLPAELVVAEIRTQDALMKPARALAHGRDPEGLAARRRRRAAGTARAALHRQIRPGAPLLQVRHHFVPEVIRGVHAEMTCIAPILVALAIDHQRDEPAELDRVVTGTINTLTAAFVRAFFPMWGATVTAGVVGTTIRNARKRERV